MHERVQGGAKERWPNTEENVTLNGAVNSNTKNESSDVSVWGEKPPMNEWLMIWIVLSLKKLFFFLGFCSFWATWLTVAAGDPVHNEPPDIEHADVVVDMKKCDLVVVLPQDEEEGVHELD